KRLIVALETRRARAPATLRNPDETRPSSPAEQIIWPEISNTHLTGADRAEFCQIAFSHRVTSGPMSVSSRKVQALSGPYGIASSLK
uniref:hypothetical protein n=1 Tax=Streptomyces djakartensis TaxID=68193 RepID=UPI0034DEB98B